MWGALSDERTGLVLASAVVLGSESRGTRDHILLSQIRDFPFVASYDSQGYGGGIRPRLHTGWLTDLLRSVSYNRQPGGLEDTMSSPSISCFPMHLPLEYSLPRNLTVKASVSVATTYYIRVSDAAVVSLFISAETETNSNCRRCLAMDVCFDSYNRGVKFQLLQDRVQWLFLLTQRWTFGIYKCVEFLDQQSDCQLPYDADSGA
jgi:hypothetical protein